MPIFLRIRSQIVAEETTTFVRKVRIRNYCFFTLYNNEHNHGPDSYCLMIYVVASVCFILGR